MRIFNLKAQRDRLDGPVGYRWNLERRFDDSKAAGGLASSADAYLNMAVDAILVGYDEPATHLTRRALEWLAAAIETDEKGPDDLPGGPEASRYECVAMGNWLLFGIQDRDALAKFVHCSDIFMKEGGMGQNAGHVALTLPSYVDARAYQDALDLSAEAPGLLPPTSLSLIRNDGQMCYVICQHRLGLRYSEQEVNAATDRFLKKNVNTWLLDGHYSRAALWMKIVHWREGTAGISPKEAILKCYDYLPTPNKPKQ